MSDPKTFLKWGATDYELVPVQDPYGASLAWKLRKFDDESLKNIPSYTYKPLLGARKKIRLLQLMCGTMENPDISCQLVEANYDNVFHIPIIGDPQTSDKSSGSQSPDLADVKVHHPHINDEEMLGKLKLYDELTANEIKYEALSWCWGKDESDYALLIFERTASGHEKTYKLRVREQLALALKHLRHTDRSRTMWIDAVCIDQNNPSERNHQVQMMSRIYTRSDEVCIWLGDSDDSSKLAIDFIRDEIMELRNFDALSKGKQYTNKWKALMMLMQREWFSRRWVVQEIALANKATIHCGADKISWKKFSVAVELFVEVETATHRLSEIMQKDEKFRHIPGWFEYVSELGASLLVQATGKVFRAQRSPLEPMSNTDGQQEDYMRKKFIRDQTIDPLDRRSLLSLEYLVSTMFIFQASEPRDTIYAMIAISRDAAPFASSGETIRDHHDNETRLIMTVCESFLEEKPFTIDYRRPYADVCKDFIQFAIERKAKLDPAQALDILCRPWALDPRPGGKALPARLKTGAKTNSKAAEAELKSRPVRPPRQYYMDKAPVEGQRPDGGPRVSPEQQLKEPSPPSEPWTRMKLKYFPPRVSTVEESHEGSPEEKNARDKTPGDRKDEQELGLPTWISRASQAPFSLDHSPGIDIQKTGRANADPLVGHSQDGHRNYSAAQTQKVRPLMFRRRPQLGCYSLYVQGFELDVINEVMDASQGGNIPKSWLELATWSNYKKQDSPAAGDDEQGDPPGELWRTLVADRGKDNRNPPYYYARACRESVNKGGIASGRVDTAALINNERNSIVAEFCRRVHAVIWNRRLFKTKKGRLGLARDDVKKGDKICILYGCTVPVVLQSHEKSTEERKLEREEDRVESLKRVIRKLERRCEVIRKHNAKVAKGETMKEKIDVKRGELTKEQFEKFKTENGILTAEDLKSLTRDRKKAEKALKKLKDLNQFSQGSSPKEIKEQMHDEEDSGDDRHIPRWNKNKPEIKRPSTSPDSTEGKDGSQSSAAQDNIDSQTTSPEDGGSERNTTSMDDSQTQIPAPEALRSLEQTAPAMASGSESVASSVTSDPTPGISRSQTTHKKREEKAKRDAPGLWYTFKGECYLHGMMDGEAMRERIYQDIVDGQVFELR